MLLFKAFIPIVILGVLSGCGYSLNHRLKSSFVDRRGIYVPVFANHTEELGAERAFTNALVRELLSHREVVLGSSQEKGLELRGAVTAVDYGPSAFTEPGYQGLRDFKRIPTEYGVRVTIHLSLVDPQNGASLWSESFTGSRRVNVHSAEASRTYDYQAPSSIGPQTTSIVQSVFAEIAADLMRSVYDSMVEQL